MTEDDVLFGFRLRLFTAVHPGRGARQRLRGLPGNGVARSTYYAWKPKLERYGLDGLRVRERRRPRMPNQVGPHLEHRILAFSLGDPGFGPRRIGAELARAKWGDQDLRARLLSVLRRFNLNTPIQAAGADRPPRRPL